MCSTCRSAAFSSGNSYTAATGEVMGGTLTRRSGAETLDPARGLVLNGSGDGGTFPAGQPAQRRCRAAVVPGRGAFTPAATQGNLATVFGMGGASTGYNGTNLQYGFDSEVGGDCERHEVGAGARTGPAARARARVRGHRWHRDPACVP